MARLRLIVCLAIFVPAWTLLGAASTMDSGLFEWRGLSVCAAIDLFFGLIFGGHRGRWFDWVFGPEEKDDGPS